MNIKAYRIPPVANLTFDYSKVDEKYRASKSSDDVLTLYKGAPRGIENNGFLSLAIINRVGEKLHEIKSFVENSKESLLKIFDAHTSHHHNTPFLSATFNPEMAQAFAHDRLTKTIYKIRIKARRCLLDYYDTGKCGASKEILIFGVIFPDEIEAIKISNEDSDSELLNEKSFIKYFPDKDSVNIRVKNPNNWKEVFGARQKTAS